MSELRNLRKATRKTWDTEMAKRTHACFQAL